MNRRLALLFVIALSGSAGIAGTACSSSNESGGSGDAGAQDGSVGGDAAVDSGGDVGVRDTGPGADSGGDGGIVGNCSPVKGACDIVRQDCPQGQECVVVAAGGGSFATACNPVQASEHIPKGAPCCPSSSGNPCLPGLECLGAACVDGSAPTSRCTPHCCSGDDSLCGTSPEGFKGTCNLVVSSGGSPSVDLFNACTYSATCVPLGVEPCPSGMVCIVQDQQGTAKCVQSYAADAAGGYGEGHPCSFANNCQDGFNCLSFGDAGGACTMLCLVPGSSPPFDAGSLTGGPLH